MTKNRAVLELIFAGALWGFGFVATTWSLQKYSATDILIFRFLIAFVFGEFFRLSIQKRSNWKISLHELPTFSIAGFFFGGMLLLQTLGLQYTTATKSGFITSLYIIIIPLLNSFLFKKHLRPSQWFAVFFAMIGTLLLLGDPRQDWNRGDLWTLGCALLAAGHIMYIGHLAKKQSLDAIKFNNYQTLIALVLLLPLSQNLKLPDFSSELADMGLIYLGLGASFLAFAIQVRTQKVLSDTTASMLFLLESPFAFLFGFIFLNETLQPLQLAGAAVILIASYRIVKIS